MIFAIVLVLMLSIPVASFAQDTHEEPDATAGDVNAAELAKTLADALIQSETESEIYLASIAILKTVNVGVYSTTGEPILEGAERAPEDFYLYDFEVHALARSLVRKDSRSLADVVAFLSQLGFTPDNVQLSVNVWRNSRMSLGYSGLPTLE